MAHCDAWEGKWRGNWRMEWVASTLNTTLEHGVSCINTADAHTSAASNRLNWRLCRFRWAPLFRRKTKYGFCACSITFQTQSNIGGKCSAACITAYILFMKYWESSAVHCYAIKCIVLSKMWLSFQKLFLFFFHGLGQVLFRFLKEIWFTSSQLVMPSWQ